MDNIRFMQYIGARYVPKFYINSQDPNSSDWEPNVDYEYMTWVTINNDGMYLSKSNVPANIGSPALNPEYWLYIGSYNGYITSLQNQINNIDDRIDNKLSFVSTADFDNVQDAVEYAHDNNINIVMFGRDEVIEKPILLYDNMVLDGANHKLTCANTFKGIRAITNVNSGYWNGDRSQYNAFYQSLGVNENITVKNIVLGQFYRSNYDANGNDIGGNCVPRNWLAFDSIKGLTIKNITSLTNTNVESYIWNTQAENVLIENCKMISTGYGGTGGIYWQYSRFDNSSETVTSNKNIIVKNCFMKSGADEAIAIRAYNVGDIEHCIIENSYFLSSSGQAITVDSDQGAQNDVTIKNCNFFNCGMRAVNRLRKLNIINCNFATDSNNVSNQGYFIRVITAAGISATNSPTTILIDGCTFDEFENYAGDIWAENINALIVTNCTFAAKNPVNTSIAINFGDIVNNKILNNSINNYSIAIQPYLSGTDIDSNISIIDNSGYKCTTFIDVVTRLRYATISNNRVSACTYFLTYRGVQFKDNKISDNFAETCTRFLNFPSGTSASNGISLISNNLMVDDNASDTHFFDDAITFGALHFLNNFWESFGAGSLRLYPNT